MVSDRAPERTLRKAARASLIGAIAIATAFAVNGLVGGEKERGGTTVSEGVGQEPSELPTSFRIASFNVLGAGHTDKGGNRKGWASGTQRMTWAVDLINAQSLDVIGFQELQEPQFDKFKELEGERWSLYPGARFTRAAMQNSIAWRKAAWTLVEGRMIPIPYFDGNIIRMPAVLLRNVNTGRLAWFFNTHNPADAHGPAQRWRDAGYKIEIKLVNQLQLEMPNVPVFSTGDKNDRDQYFCPVVRGTQLRAAIGGGIENDSCRTPSPSYVDWVMGTKEVPFTWDQALRTRLVRKITDHPVIVSSVTIPPISVVQSPVDHVVLLNLEGLTTKALVKWGNEDNLRLADLIASGASTLNARTAYERTTNLPNMTGIVTGRGVVPAKGGHGVGWGTDPGTTVHAAAGGGYVASVFDVTHDHKLSTSLFTTDEGLARLDLTWNGTNGSADFHGDDEGRDKISDYVYEPRSRKLIDRLTGQMTSNPSRLTVVSLSLLTDVGVQYGFGSDEYRAALVSADRMVRKVLRAISEGPMNGRTLTVITSTHGGTKKAFTPADALRNYRVPIIVTGPGVAAGADLYDLNPQFTRPQKSRPGADDPQPIRLEDLANLLTRHLGMPGVPGATANGQQALIVTPPYVPLT